MRLAAGKLLIPAGKSLVASLVQTFGTLRNYDQNRNRFNEQNNNSARAPRFFVQFFAIPA